MHGLGLCMKIKIYVTHMFHAWSLIQNKDITIELKDNKYHLSLDIYTTIFVWRYGN